MVCVCVCGVFVRVCLPSAPGCMLAASRPLRGETAGSEW